MEIRRTLTINGIEFEAYCEIDYTISGGQEEIWNAPPEDCQQGFPPDVEIFLESVILYPNKGAYQPKKNGAYWLAVEEFLNEDDTAKQEVLEDVQAEYEADRDNCC